MAFLGWNPGTDQEIFTHDELIAAFSFERIGKSGARFDPEKAKWFNQQHMRLKSGEELAGMLKPYLETKGVEVDADYLTKVCNAMKDRAVFIPDLYELGTYFFGDIESYDEDTIRKKWKPEKQEFFLLLIEKIKSIDNFTEHSIEAIVKDTMKEHNIGMGEIMPLLRIALAGVLQGPPVFAMMDVLGKKNSIDRLQKALEKFNNFQ